MAAILDDLEQVLRESGITAILTTHDQMDAEALHRALVQEVIPLYYDRDRDGLPRGWITRMKKSIRSLGWRFNADRMVMDYVTKCYIPAAGGTSSDMSMRG